MKHISAMEATEATSRSASHEGPWQRNPLQMGESIFITSWLQSDESEKSWKIFHCSTSCIIIFQSISSGECLGKYMEALWSTDKCKEIHHKSFSHLIVYAFLDTFGGCSEFHLTACHERDWHQINMSFNLKEKKRKAIWPNLTSFLFDRVHLRLWVSLRHQARIHKVTRAHPTPSRALLSASFPCARRHPETCPRRRHYLVHKITVISL